MRNRANDMHESGKYIWLDQFRNPSTVSAFAPFAEEIMSCLNLMRFELLSGHPACYWEQVLDCGNIFLTLSSSQSSLHLLRCCQAAKQGLTLSMVLLLDSFRPCMTSPASTLQWRLIPEKEARNMCRRLAKEEGIFAGTSTGLNVCAALRIADRLGPDHHVVTVACDTGFKHMSRNLFSSQ